MTNQSKVLELANAEFNASKYMQVVYSEKSRQPYLDGFMKAAALLAAQTVSEQPSQPSQPKDSKEGDQCVPHTYAGFLGGFISTHRRPPNDQEIFDAGMRAGRDIQWPGQPVAQVTDEMVRAYLEANDAYWKEQDAMPHKNPSKWRNGTPQEATAVSLRAALSRAQSAAPAAQVGERDLLEKIDAKASGALCCFSFGGAREFVKEIRQIVANALAAHPQAAQDKGGDK